MKKLFILLLIGGLTLVSFTIIKASLLNEIQVELIAGNYKNIRLEKNPSNDYKWSYTITKESIIQVLSEKYFKKESDEAKIDTEAIHIWKIKGVQKGNTIIKFTLKKEDKVCKVKKYKIEVKPKRIEVIKGNYIQIQLEENPTTGYSWHYSIKDNKKVEIISDNYSAHKHEASQLGVGGIHNWNIKGLKPGKTKIRFEYYQEWNPKGIGRSREYIISVLKEKD